MYQLRSIRGSPGHARQKTRSDCGSAPGASVATTTVTGGAREFIASGAGVTYTTTILCAAFLFAFTVRIFVGERVAQCTYRQSLS